MILIHNCSTLLALSARAQRGPAMGELNALPGGAVLIEGETIAELGPESALLARYPQAERLNAGGCALLPGFVDPHTHLVWSGDRAGEFEMRLQGYSYMQIMASGGGIASTVKATREASLDELLAQSRARALAAFRHGSTTIEAKTGYGLDLETEFKQLEVILRLNAEGPFELVPSWMGAHAIPAGFPGGADGYSDWICQTALPATRDWWLAHAAGQGLPFVDVFCEQGVFELAQTERILRVAKSLGFPLKLHVDEFANLGGAQLAVKMGATSADHLVKTSAEDIRALASSQTVAVSLPGTPFGLGQTAYTPAKALIEAGACLALATDLNPGTTWNPSMQFIQALACRSMGLTPAQALLASTINAAKAVGLEDRLGSITVGKQADLLILRVADWRHLTYRYGENLVGTVIKRGKVYPNESAL